MGKRYSDELLNMKFSVDVLDGTKPERTFFAITEESLRDVYHVLPTDSLEEARKKIMEVVSKDEFLYEYFHKDPRNWDIIAFDPGYWTTPTKEERVLSKSDLQNLGYSDEEIMKMRMPVKSTDVKQTYQQKLTIKFAKRKPINAYSDETFFKLYDEEFKKFLSDENILSSLLKSKLEVKQPKKQLNKKYDNEKMLVIPDVELHIGKLASKFDSTDSYDYKKALYRYIKIMLEAEKVQEQYKAKEICMTIGNDFFNTDTEQNTTTAGTEQHNDTRFQQMIANGIVAHMWAIERMKKNCDKVILKFNPGNHDYLTDYTLFMQLYYQYRNDPKVEVECRVKDSRWATGLTWGRNLIIFSHGKTPEGRALNDDNLALLKDTMFKEEAKLVDHTTVLAGHLHNASENNFSKKKNASNGVTVLRNGSPSGDGAWDSGNLYSSDKSHQVYVFDYNRGLYSTVNIKLTKEELDRGITLTGITEDTDYLRTLEDCVEAQTDNIILEDTKKMYVENEKEMRNIYKKYRVKVNELGLIVDNTNLTQEQEESILGVLGYYDEIRPYVEKREAIEKYASEKGLSLSRRLRTK